jgi:hypothetical protein
MHDLIFAVAFIAMVATPAMVATLGGRKEYNPGPAAPSLRPVHSLKARPVAGPAVRPPVDRKLDHEPAQKRPPADHPRKEHALKEHALVTSTAATLPMHNARGMANR